MHGSKVLWWTINSRKVNAFYDYCGAQKRIYFHKHVLQRLSRCSLSTIHALYINKQWSGKKHQKKNENNALILCKLTSFYVFFVFSTLFSPRSFITNEPNFSTTTKTTRWNESLLCCAVWYSNVKRLHISCCSTVTYTNTACMS